jgi:hypothetical protein
MEDWVGTVIRDYGTLGIILIGIVIWACNKWIKPLLVGDDKKSSKAAQSTNDNSSNNSNVINVHTGESEQGVYSKEDLIYDAVRDLKVIVNDNNTRLNELSHRFNDLQDDFDEKVAYLESRVNQMPVENIVKAFGEADRIKAENEQKMFLDSLRLGAAANKLLEDYTTKINCTHIFVASFHNGTSSLTGNPYFKFDIIKEAYHPTDIQENDHPFEPVYRDCQLSLLGKLPEMLVEKGTLYFILDDDNNNTEMQSYDNIIINRMKGMGIKQIALNVAYYNELVSGFVGCVKYDNKENINIKMLQECTHKLELIYKRNKTNEIIYGED